MRTLWFVLIALFIGLGGSWWYQSTVHVTAQDTRAVTVHAYASDTGKEGERCYGMIDSDGVSPWRQMIVTDAAGTIVGYMDLRGGVYTEIEGTIVCTVSAELALPPSSFYTFEIEGKHKRTISVGALDDIDWELFAHV